MATLLTNKTKMHWWLILPLICRVATIFKGITCSSNRIWSMCPHNMQATKVMWLIRIFNRTFFRILSLRIYSHPKVTNSLNVNLSWFKNQNRLKILPKHILQILCHRYQRLNVEMKLLKKICSRLVKIKCYKKRNSNFVIRK